MSEAERLEAKALARARARARRARTRAIRRRTFRGSLALFAILWAIVFAQLASGEDPALNGKSAPSEKRQRAVAPEAEFEAEFEEEFVPEEELPVEEEFVEPEPAPIVTGAS